MKKISLKILVAFATVQTCFASDFTIQDGKTIKEFSLIDKSSQGNLIFNTESRTVGLPGNSVDKYTVDCTNGKAWVQYGLATGGGNQINVPGNDTNVQITNRSDLTSILSRACARKEKNNLQTTRNLRPETESIQ
jgi:hypothetical protein